jgi:hypothetical protein
MPREVRVQRSGRLRRCETYAKHIDKKALLTNFKASDHKTPAEESSSLALLLRAGAEGATAPETLRLTDRSGMTLWKAIFHI